MSLDNSEILQGILAAAAIALAFFLAVLFIGGFPLNLRAKRMRTRYHKPLCPTHLPYLPKGKLASVTVSKCVACAEIKKTLTRKRR
jgi:hypothetical protein